MRISTAQAKKLGLVKQTPKKVKAKINSDSSFRAFCRWHGLPEPEPEYKFHPTRKWRFDWAWVNEKVALEIEGGAFRGPGHRSVGVFLRNMTKYNEANILGWTLLRVTTDDITSGAAFALVKRALYGDCVWPVT